MNKHLWLLLTASVVVMVACGVTGEPVAEEPSPAEAEPAEAEPVAEPDVEDEEEDAVEEEMAEEEPSHDSDQVSIQSEDVEVTSDGQAYLSYLAAPAEGGPYPAVVLIHSFNGLEDGYRTMTDQFAAQGFVVLAVGWQTFERGPSDATMEQLLLDSVAFLSSRDDVDPERLGLTGFCAGGRYTMLFLPQLDAFKAGVAWYGFPYGGDTQPADVIDGLTAPMLIIHGTDDQPSPIADIYRYATSLDEAGKSFEVKVYSDEPHGFMLADGQLRQDEVASDAFAEMVSFFRRKLG